jgi:hypothetical protein
MACVFTCGPAGKNPKKQNSTFCAYRSILLLTVTITTARCLRAAAARRPPAAPESADSPAQPRARKQHICRVCEKHTTMGQVTLTSKQTRVCGACMRCERLTLPDGSEARFCYAHRQVRGVATSPTSPVTPHKQSPARLFLFPQVCWFCCCGSFFPSRRINPLHALHPPTTPPPAPARLRRWIRCTFSTARSRGAPRR